MKRVSLLLTLSSSVLLLAVSCKKGDKTGLLVPEDAGVVVHINSASLSSKLSLGGDQPNRMVQRSYQKKPPTVPHKNY